jgi:hypothetical protein
MNGTQIMSATETYDDTQTYRKIEVNALVAVGANGYKLPRKEEYGPDPTNYKPLPQCSPVRDNGSDLVETYLLRLDEEAERKIQVLDPVPLSPARAATGNISVSVSSVDQEVLTGGVTVTIIGFSRNPGTFRRVRTSWFRPAPRPGPGILVNDRSFVFFDSALRLNQASFVVTGKYDLTKISDPNNLGQETPPDDRGLIFDPE